MEPARMMTRWLAPSASFRRLGRDRRHSGHARADVVSSIRGRSVSAIPVADRTAARARARAAWADLGDRLATVTPAAVGRAVLGVAVIAAITLFAAGTWPALLPFAVGGLLAYAVLPVVDGLDRIMPRALAAGRQHARDRRRRGPRLRDRRPAPGHGDHRPRRPGPDGERDRASARRCVGRPAGVHAVPSSDRSWSRSRRRPRTASPALRVGLPTSCRSSCRRPSASPARSSG